MKQQKTRWLALGAVALGVIAFAGEDGKSTTIKLEDPVRLNGPAKGVYGIDLADMNGDGKLDLVGGDYSGNIYLGLNTGSKTAPAFAAHKKLQADQKPIQLSHW